MLLREILAEIPAVEFSGTPDVRIRGITYDSRLVRDGYLFVALKGERSDGALFVSQALERGAAAIASELPLRPAPGTAALKVADGRLFLAEASRVFFQDPASRLKLVAITGTNGKTTTSYLVDSVYRQARLRSCLLGTIGRKIVDQPFPTRHTTPEASDLMLFLREAVMAGCTHGALEVSSHALSLKRVYGTRFTVGVFTNLTQDHLDFHGDMESYYQAKRILFSPAGENRIETAVINLDDPAGRRLSAEISMHQLLYGWHADADVRLLESDMRADGTALRLATPSGELLMHTGLVGRPNTYNVMAAVGAALSLGIDKEIVRQGIEAAARVPGRMEPVDAGQPFSVFVDYAHTPDALEKLLQTVSDLPHGRIITVFGCGGDRDRKKRPIMGEVAARLSDLVVATSDNPRTEDPAVILEEIEAGLKRGPAPYRIIPDRRAAVGHAVSIARDTDVVLIAGKGHEDYQIIGTRAFPFDDRVVARESILESSNADPGAELT
jgi:UDP-N-acetylmuramoyl-L-alanyl-D-glutamate--2,6-diaminopimelate ligase